MGFALSDLELTSPSFSDGEAIPRRHSGYGADVSPGLRWSGLPQGTRSLALVVQDADAPFVGSNGAMGLSHWVLYNVPAEVGGLPEGLDTTSFTVGRNSMGEARYAGPKPPAGHGLHRYFFWLLALAIDPQVRPALTAPELLATVEPHVVGANRLVGSFMAPT